MPSRVCRQPGCLSQKQVLSYPKASILSSTASLVKLSPRVSPLGQKSPQRHSGAFLTVLKNAPECLWGDFCPRVPPITTVIAPLHELFAHPSYNSLDISFKRYFLFICLSTTIVFDSKTYYKEDFIQTENPKCVRKDPKMY